MPPEQNYDDIRQRMEALRSSLDDDVEQVATSVRTKTDWRYYVRNHPWLAVGVATAVGYLLVPSRVQQVERFVSDPEALAQLAKKEKLVLVPESRVRANKSGFLNKIAALALAAGSRAAVGFLGNKLGSVADNNAESEHEAPFANQAARPR